MQSLDRFAVVAGIIVVVLGVSSTAHSQSVAHGQTVAFTELNDAVPARFFDAASSFADPYDGNRLIVGFHKGTDAKTWRAKDFRASTAALSHTIAMDTLSFSVVAPEGFYIARITYSQKGTGSTLRTGKASGATHWVVGDSAEDLGTFATNPTLSWTMDLTGLNRTTVPVSITSSLFAFAPPALGSASVAVTGAEVYVDLLPLTEAPPQDGSAPISQ